MDDAKIRKFNADIIERSIKSDRETFTRDAAYMSSLAVNIANAMQEGRAASGDLTALSQRVAALLVLAAKIESATEVHAVMSVEVRKGG